MNANPTDGSPRRCSADPQCVGSTFVYVVTSTAPVNRVNPPADFLHGDLMIQTSWTQGRVLLVDADQKLP